MLEKRKKENQIRLWIETEKERLLLRAYGLEDHFLRGFYVQCIESTSADAHEIFLETHLCFNYFRNNLEKLNEATMLRFFKLAAIHHTIRIVCRRKKELSWEGMVACLKEVYLLQDFEGAMADCLFQCAKQDQTVFKDLFHKTTARYLFQERELSCFSFAFIGNFWYNSYSSFMGAFSGYVPFHIRMKQAL